MIILFQRLIANYRLAVFKKLSKEANITICVSEKSPKKFFFINSKPDFTTIKLKTFYLFFRKKSLIFQNVMAIIFKYKPKIVIIEFALSIISNWIFFFLRPFFKYKIILWSHGYDRKVGFNPQKHIADRLRIYLMNRSDAVILYDFKSKEKIKPYIGNSRKIFIAPNTLDTEYLLKMKNDFKKTGKNNIKKELALKEKYNLIFLGRLLEEKEPFRLINVFKIVTNQIESIQLHIVGDGPLYSNLSSATKSLNVRYWGEVSGLLLIGKLLYSSDLMVMPSSIGLSIVHSFCFECPVVTQEVTGNEIHGPEIEYLINNENGFLTRYGYDEEMADKIIEYLLSDDLIKVTIRNNIITTIEEKCSIEKMIEGFKSAIEYCSYK